MNIKRSGLYMLLVMLLSAGWTGITDDWMVERHKAYTFYYSSDDRQHKPENVKLINNGIKAVQTFFGSYYKNKFDVYIYPHREALDKQWQKDWHMPAFKSDCWMVASGVAERFDALSPAAWDKEACEHSYADKRKTQQLFTHELVHVFHGQLNASPDFSDVDRIDWFVEGLATYASGQCDAPRIAAIKRALSDKKIPGSLDNFWEGNLKYALAGSMVMYIDQRYGRPKLKELMKYNKKDEILGSLKATEGELLGGWKMFMENYPSTK